VKKYSPDNPSGGYIVEYSNNNIEPQDILIGPLEGWENPFIVKYPRKGDGLEDEGAWLFNYITEFNEVLINAPDWQQRYRDYIDVDSSIDYFLAVELTKNPDGYRGSTWFSKDRDGPIVFGPVWDYNEAFGLCCGKFPIFFVPYTAGQ
jgi:hypothetical protein